MDAERWNRTHVVKYLFEYVMKCSERVVSESLLKSPPRVWSEQGHMNVEWGNRTQVVKYLFGYMMKGSEWVGSESVLESAPRSRSEQLRSFVADIPNHPPAPSTTTTADKRLSHEVQADA